MDGAIAELTGNHIIPVIRDKKQIDIKVSELKENDFLITF